MQEPYGTIIAALWLVWLAYWLISAVRVKPVARTAGAQSQLAASIPLAVAAWLLLGAQVPAAFDVRFLASTPAAGIAATAITAAGLAVAVWARLALGGNWSGTVTVKQDHELIERGPYALVRHPIYTGLILALFGSVVAFGSWRAVAALALAVAGLWYKLRTEERMMRETFGANYDDYAKRVKALVPFVL